MGGVREYSDKDAINIKTVKSSNRAVRTTPTCVRVVQALRLRSQLSFQRARYVMGRHSALTVMTKAAQNVSPEPPTVAFGSSNPATSHYTVGTIVKYGCNTGYTIEGSDFIVCSPGGTWSQPPVCVKTCPSTLPVFPNTSPMPSDTPYISGSVIIYTCIGSKVDDHTKNSTITCMPDGTWSGDDPPVIQYGYALDAKAPYTVMDVVTYACAVGSALVGNNHSSCKADGTWTTPPVCKRVCEASLPKFSNALPAFQTSPTSQSPPYFVGTIIIYSCEAGFDEIGNNFIVCLDDGTWFGEPKCSAKCSAPPMVPFTNAVANDANVPSIGSTATYNCITGYALEENAAGITAVCLKDLTWAPLPECKKVCTDAPPNFDNATPVPHTTPTFVGTIIEYTCDDGYEIGPNCSNTITCDEDGCWKGTVQCIRTCLGDGLQNRSQDSPVTGPGEPYFAGDRVVYECNGISTINPCTSNFAECRADGTWSTPNQCHGPPMSCSGPDNEGCTNPRGTTVEGTTYQWRLCDGGGDGVCAFNKGRLEVRQATTGAFKPVCNDDWLTHPNLHVACKMLGFRHAVGMSNFRPGGDDFALDNVRCGGSETNLIQCPSNGFDGSDNCGAHDYVGIICTNECMTSL
ncbi:CSMD3-like protein [Mya arenaria]|uniref:CSMD3-like protein n=1 Tax=Mya arenaria TaxID=6604 RepID=A0ABY7G2S2_MYAAR|nr:CSMD3-like protein [Mya arenaria]